MRAVQLVGWQMQPELREVPVPVPGPGEVLLKVEAAGLCHSDLHLMEFPEGLLPFTLPFTLGHESAGTVAALGAGVRGFEEGDPVIVYGPWGCETCWQCLRGASNICERGLGKKVGGLGLDGGLADYLLVPSPRWLVPVKGLDLVSAAPLSDAALTPYHGIKTELHRLRPGSCVVVIGVGGLGHVGVQLLKALSQTRVIAIDPRESSRTLALDAGADVALDSTVDAAGVRSETGALGATLVLDFVGAEQTVQLAASVVSTGGHVTVFGLGNGTFPLAFGKVPLETSASRPSWGTLPELHEVVALAQAGAIHLEVERFALTEAVEAYKRLHDGAIVGRAVVVP